MKRNLIFSLLVALLWGCTGSQEDESVFSFHLFMEPQHLDPARSRASSASYFFYNTLRGLYKISSENTPVEEGGRCDWSTPQKLTCHLNNDKWSNGDPVTAEDYVRSFRHLVDPATASPRAFLLRNLVGYEKILAAEAPPEQLGVESQGTNKLVFNFRKKDPEFFYKLASTALYPTHKNHDPEKSNFSQYVVNGPYQVKNWTPGKLIRLEANPHYTRGHKNRPPLEIHFIDDELTAYRLYEKKKLSFLRRIPSQLISTLKDRDDFFQQPMLRFDYIGFGERVMQQASLRAALSQSVDYEKLKVLLGALERPGCPSIPKTWLVKQKCLEFNVEAARKSLEDVPETLRNQPLQLKVSALGGNDIKKQAEFFQNQWKIHLGLDVQVSQVEQTTFLNELRSQPPDIFRKGVGIDRPTCLSALETFSEDSGQNFIDLNNPDYVQWLKQLEESPVQSPDYRKTCQKAVDFLLENHLLIPLGEMHFTLMASPLFSGWTLNGMNQLDLSQLHLTP